MTEKPLMSGDFDATPLIDALGLGELGCTLLSIDLVQGAILTFTGTFEMDVRQLEDLVESLRPFRVRKA